MERFVISTSRISPKKDARRVHLITADTAAAILGISKEEIERQYKAEPWGPWGLSITYTAPDGEVVFIAEEILRLAELWEQAEQEQ